MFGLGMGEIVVILIVALLVLGPNKLPEAAKQIGKAIRELRKHTDSLRETIETDEQLGGTVREIKSALRGDPYTVMRAVVKPLEEEGKKVEEAAATAGVAVAAASGSASPNLAIDPPTVHPPEPPRPEGAVAQGEPPSGPEGGRPHG
jgi:Tat protein translocase TatB subunit